MSNLAKDFRLLRRQGYTTVFVDEVTLLPDFIDFAAMLADVFAAMEMTIVLSGADSLGFWIASGNALYDRCTLIHITFIPFAQWSVLLGMHDIDDYIAYGGILSTGIEGVDERDVSKLRLPFADIGSMRRYIAWPLRTTYNTHLSTTTMGAASARSTLYTNATSSPTSSTAS